MTDRTGVAPGQQLGNYRLIRSLGQGGFAEVYLGEHIYLKKQAAIKVLHTKLSKDAQQGFLNEARIIAHLRHPAIVRILEFGIEDGTPFLVMNYAPNGTLRHHLPKGVPLPQPTIISYVKQVAAALQYAHDQKLIHRDIKPENMLLGRNGEVLLSDFGIAIIARNTNTQSIQKTAGTVAYMAPEQIRGKPRPASDQYALGVVVYEWLCGSRPFSGTFYSIAEKHVTTPPPPLHEKVSGISPAVEEVVLRALAKDPHRRFESVQAFATALEEAYLRESALASAPTRLLSVAMPSPSVAVPPKKTGSRLSRRATIAGLAGLVGLTVVGGGIAWYEEMQSHTTHSKSHTTHPIGTTFYIYHGHSDSVNDVAWSPDGRHIASASSDKTVQVWDATTGGNVITYRGHSDTVNAIAWSPNGKYIASASSDKTVQVWDATTGGNVITYRGHSAGVYAVAWSPDGRRIASAGGQAFNQLGDYTVQVWDAIAGNRVFTYRGHSDQVTAVAWAPDGKRIASASDTVAWAPDGKRIASANGTVQVWDATAWHRLLTHSSQNIPGTVGTEVWDPGTGRTSYTYQGQPISSRDGFPIHAHTIAWSPDSIHLALRDDAKVQLWNATTGHNIYGYLGHTETVNAVAWSPDGTRITSASSTTVHVWQAT